MAHLELSVGKPGLLTQLHESLDGDRRFADRAAARGEPSQRRPGQPVQPQKLLEVERP